MSIDHLIAVIVEWPNLGEEPSLLTAIDRETATRMLIAAIDAQDVALVNGLRSYDSTPENWWHDNPAPTETADLTDIGTWLDAYVNISDVTWSWYPIDLAPYHLEES